MKVAAQVLGEFAQRLVPWQLEHGRHGLPWQASRDPYLVWLSEVMLQQTQVSTVLDYFPRFLARFPNVAALAEASSDEVMALWSGLGYYSRARNLHRCAQMVMEQHGGAFPTTSEALQTLPGIGASTAAAIAAFCFGERVSILDGNVRRVITRLTAYEGDVSQTVHQKALWALAQSLLPETATGGEMKAYTQGLMDLGATVCTRSKPACGRCPMQNICQGHALGDATRFPIKTRKVKRRHESWWLAMVMALDPKGQASVWLERRPAPGIWAGLYCPAVHADEAAATAWCGASSDPFESQITVGQAVTHNLTHRELSLHPLWAVCQAPSAWAEGKEGQWVKVSDLASWGLPAPLRPLLAQAQEFAPVL